MSQLLYLQASPRKERSKSLAVADAFIDAYRQRHPSDSVKIVNIFDMDLPPFEGPTLQAKYNILHGQESSPAERQAWASVESVIAEFLTAEKYLLAVPMWNFGIPYRLKQYIDIITQPGYTFSFSPESGYAGLVTDRPMCIVYARGGEYSGPDTSLLDHQRPYCETLLRFIGFANIQSVIVEPTLAKGPDAAAQALRQAIAAGQEIARTF